MKIMESQITEEIDVVCDNYEADSRSYHFTVVEGEDDFDPFDLDAVNKKIRQQVEEMVNPFGYWQSVRIFKRVIVGDTVYKEEI